MFDVTNMHVRLCVLTFGELCGESNCLWLDNIACYSIPLKDHIPYTGSMSVTGNLCFKINARATPLLTCLQLVTR